MADMKTLAGGVGKLYQKKALFLVLARLCLKGLVVLPLFLPLFIDTLKIVHYISILSEILSPQLVQIIKGSRLGCENVNDNVAVVNQYPGGASVAFDP